LKNLLLFFDGVALLVPSYMEEAPEIYDPAIVAGLREHDLLEILHPEELVDRNASAGLAEALGQILESGLFDDLPDADPSGASISYSRLGFGAEDLARPILEELRKRSLAGADLEGLAVQIDYRVRALALTVLAQILRDRGAARGFDLAPATDRPQVQDYFTDLLDLPSMPSSGQVVSLDTAAVGVDLSAVGIDEILEFRAAHGEEYRAYARGLRGTVAELTVAPDEEARVALLAERRAELAEKCRAPRADRLGALEDARQPGARARRRGLVGPCWRPDRRLARHRAARPRRCTRPSGRSVLLHLQGRLPLKQAVPSGAEQWPNGGRSAGTYPSSRRAFRARDWISGSSSGSILARERRGIWRRWLSFRRSAWRWRKSQ
jgi:hypothetical protein